MILLAVFGFFNNEVSFSDFIAHFFYFGAIYTPYANTIIGVEWSLNVEIAYYVIMFFLAYLWGLKYFSLPKTTLFFFVFFLIMFIGLVLGKIGLISSLSFQWSFLKWVFLFFLGGIAFHLRRYILKTGYDLFPYAIAIVALALIAMINVGLNGSIVSLLFGLFAFILISTGSDTSRVAFILNNKLLLFIGSISFSFYLLHFIVLKLLGDNLDLVSVLGALLLTIIISTVWYMVFEKRIYSQCKRYLRR